jgi:hypothetical protein
MVAGRRNPIIARRVDEVIVLKGDPKDVQVIE